MFTHSLSCLWSAASLRLVAFMVSGVVLFPAVALAVPIAWDGGAAPVGLDGTFSDALNWSPDQVPIAGDTVTFGNAGTYTVTFTGNGASDSLTVNNTGTVNLRSNNATVRTYNVTTGVADLIVNGGATLDIGSSTLPVTLNVGDLLTVGNTGSGTITVSGISSDLNVSGVGTHALGSSGNTATLNYTNSAQGIIAGTLNVAFSGVATTVGILNVNTGADLDVAHLNIGTFNSTTATGTVTVTGSGSTLDMTGASVLTIGSAAGNIGALNVDSSGVFNTGTGAVTVNSTGDINIGGGTLNLNGPTTINGGTLTKTSGTLGLANGSTMTLQNGGQANITGTQSIGGTTVVVNGATSNLSISGTTSIGVAGQTGVLRFENNASGSLAGVDLAVNNTNNSNGTLQVNGGSTVGVSGNINLATFSPGGTGQLAMLELVGTLNQSGATSLTLGNSTTPASSEGRMNVLGSAAVFTSGTGGINVRNQGIISIDSSGPTLNLNGPMVVDQGIVEVDGSGAAPNFNLGSGASVTVQNAGVFQMPNVLLGGGNNMTVTGVGSSATVALSLHVGNSTGSSNVTVSSGGLLTGMDLIRVAANSTAGTGTHQLDVLSGGDITNLTTVLLGTNTTGTFTGIINVDGVGSTVTQVPGAGGLTVGGQGASTGTLILQNSGSWTTGAGNLTTIGATGLIDIVSGTFNAGGNLIVNGGQLRRQSGGTLNQTSGTTTSVINNGQFTVTGSYNPPDALFTVNTGGDASFTSFFDMTSAADQLIVDGAGSSFSATGTGFADSRWSAGSAGTFRNNAMGTFGDLSLASTSDASLNVQSGADVSFNLLGVSSSSFSGTGTVTLTDPGSSITANNLTIGSQSAGGAGLINVLDEATLTVNTGTSLNSSGTLTVDGATVSLGTLTDNGGAINFLAGALTYGGNLSVGLGGLLGANLTLASNRQLTLSGTTTVTAVNTLTLDGGSLSTGSLVVNGTFDFQEGTLAITGSGGLTIGAPGALGANVVLNSGTALNTTNTTTIQSGATLLVDGGTFVTGSLVNSGNVILDAGSASVTSGLTNQSGGFLVAGANRTLTANGASTNAGEIQLGGGAATLAGSGVLTNTGLVRGDGRITKPVNNAGGELRAETGKRLKLEGVNGVNAGRINLQGGTAEFTQALTNPATGQITGRGTLIVGGAGLTNIGHMAFASGVSDVFGDLVTNTGSASVGITVSGNADVTFWGDVTNTSGLFHVADRSSATFFGAYSGGGISGDGDKFFEADVTPGFSPGIASFDGNVFLGPAATSVIELGGLQAGEEHDQLDVAGQLSLGGTLEVALYDGFTPVLGDVFDILNFGALAGHFNEIDLPLVSGLSWDTSELYTSGTIRAVPEPSSCALILLGLVASVPLLRKNL